MNTPVDFDILIEFIDAKIFDHKQRHLRNVEVNFIKGMLDGKTYEEICQIYNIPLQYIHSDIGINMYKLLSEIFGEIFTKSTAKTLLEKYFNISMNQE
jgi:hypothetical protein